MAVLIVGSVVQLLLNKDSSLLLPALFLLLVLTVISVSFHCRSFALKAQDRAIRAEEGLRYFILTGRRLDPAISLERIIALRFASDEELVALAARAMEQDLSPDEIKRAIKNWRPDHYRA